MNRLTKFFHEMWNPHCEHCEEEQRESRICQSCETLRTTVATLTDDNRRLLSALTKEPPIPEPVAAPAFQPILPKSMPWGVRRQMLEAEARAEAKLKKNAVAPSGGQIANIEGISELEAELNIAEAARET